MYTYFHVKNNQKYQKSHGNSKISHAKSAFFLHKVNPGQPPSPAIAFFKRRREPPSPAAAVT